MNYERAKDILQIKEPINKKDVKKSYYSLAIKYHPDKSKDNSQKFLEIKEATHNNLEQVGGKNYHDTIIRFVDNLAS